jgi:hypothetical protein
MLEALKFREIDDTSHFIGAEHPIHCCFQELDSDVSSNFSPDVVSTEFFNPLRINLSGKHPGIPQIFSLRYDQLQLVWRAPPVPGKPGSRNRIELLLN